MPTLNLAQLKKRAKELKSLAMEGSTAARTRLDRAGISSASRNVKLTEAQHAIAYEAGFPSWPKLKSALTHDFTTRTGAETALVEAALAGDSATVERVLEQYPDITSESLAAGCILAGAHVPDRLDADNANRKTGPYDWEPLLYVCSGAATAAGGIERADITKRLIELGADPNVGCRERKTIRGYRTALGAAIGLARDAALAKYLVDAGADTADGPTLYEGSSTWYAVKERDLTSLEVLLDAEPPHWHLCHALPHCLRFNDLAPVELLLSRGADPNWNKTEYGFDGSSLHEAIAVDASIDIIDALLAAGAIVDLPGRDGRTALQLATCLNRTDIVDALRRAGADPERVREEDRWVAACFRREEDENLRPRTFLPVDHLWLNRATHAETIEALLAGGLDPNCQDDDGARPLHRAVAAANHAAISALLRAGADPTLTDFGGRMPIDIAIERDDAVAINQLEVDSKSRRWDDADFVELFERAADATIAGDIETLRSLIAEHPDLVHARSSRAHRATLLHYLGANGVEGERQVTPKNGPDMIHCLLDAGADPDATCFTYRGGPEGTTMGLLISSGHPLNAGVLMEMVRALADGGATLDDATAILVHLHRGHPLGHFSPLDRHQVETALWMAIGFDEIGFARSILDSGVEFDIDADPHGDGATALHQAAINGREEAIELLLSHSADPLRRDATFNGRPSGWANAGGFAALGERLAAIEASREG